MKVESVSISFTFLLVGAQAGQTEYSSKCKKNVNVYAYSLISHRVQQTLQFTPLVLELSLVRSHLLCGEFSKTFLERQVWSMLKWTKGRDIPGRQ